MVKLDTYKHTYQHGNKLRILFWILTSIVFFKSSIPFPMALKRALLRAFGAKIGLSVIIKPSVNIKYPWMLEVGDYSWIGENVWIDNLDIVKIGSNSCLSQGCYILTGNHNYKSSAFDLFINPVIINSGAWVGAKAIVTPGVTMGESSILTVGSIATNSLDDHYIYQGNPAVKKKKRDIR